MAIFSGKNSSKPASEHIKNILEIIRFSLIEEEAALQEFELTFWDAYKENHFLAIVHSGLRYYNYATILESSSTGKKRRKKVNVRNDMLIYYGKDWDDYITLEFKMIWSTDRHNKIASFANDIEKLHNTDDISSYIVVGLYLYNQKYEENNRRRSTEEILEEYYRDVVNKLEIQHQIQNFEGNNKYDFKINPPIEDKEPIDDAEKWDRCRMVYCAKVRID